MNVATVPVLKQSLRHPDPMYRFAGALAIGNRKQPMQEELIGLLEDEDVCVQQMARQSLVKLSNGQDFGPLPGCACKDQEDAMQQWRDWWKSRPVTAKNAKAIPK